jgi:hypothetical protein
MSDNSDEDFDEEDILEEEYGEQIRRDRYTDSEEEDETGGGDDDDDGKEKKGRQTGADDATTTRRAIVLSPRVIDVRNIISNDQTSITGAFKLAMKHQSNEVSFVVHGIINEDHYPGILVDGDDISLPLNQMDVEVS